MRNHSFVRPSLRRAALLCLALAAAFALSAPLLLAQCADDDDADSLGCPATVQQSAPSAAGESPAVLTLAQQQKQAPPRPDRSNDASASDSLSAGSSYTEGGSAGEAGLQRVRRLGSQPLSEFQRFVAASTGQTLPIFAADFFSGQPASFGSHRSRTCPGALDCRCPG